MQYINRPGSYISTKVQRKGYQGGKTIPLSDRKKGNFGCEERMQRKLREGDEQ